MQLHMDLILKSDIRKDIKSWKWNYINISNIQWVKQAVM